MCSLLPSLLLDILFRPLPGVPTGRLLRRTFKWWKVTGDILYVVEYVNIVLKSTKNKQVKQIIYVQVQKRQDLFTFFKKGVFREICPRIYYFFCTLCVAVSSAKFSAGLNSFNSTAHSPASLYLRLNSANPLPNSKDKK